MEDEGMEDTGIRMKAYVMDLDSIEVNVIKQYYQGFIPCFYLREVESGSLTEIEISYQDENEKYHNYYFGNVTLDLTKTYQIVDAYGLSETLQYTRLVELSDFDETFYYDGDDLGSHYTPEQTSFCLYAPTALDVLVKVIKDSNVIIQPLQKQMNGVFYGQVEGDLDNARYVYLIKHYTSYIEATDPYSYSSAANGSASIIINLEKLEQNLRKECLPYLAKKTKAIIYEMSVRDFTMHDSVPFFHRGKFLGVIEKQKRTPKNHLAGLDYLVDLGITHVQLMPIFDFATIDENHPEVLYNWGYDPIQYNVPEGSYASDSNDGYSRILECQQMVKELHQNGLRVIMDVVYNHLYDINANAFERIIPGYIFRRYPDGTLSNGSWCGNDVNTAALMMRKYIIDMSLRWQQIYGVDGYRFDLMGLIDTDTLQCVYQACRKQDPSFMIYGEGWNMETALSYEKRGMQENHDSIPMIGFFNDAFRDKLKGLSSGDLTNKGYFAGNMYNSGEVCTYMRNTNRYSRVDQSINYAECHDNATIFDKFLISNGEEDLVTRKKRQLLLNCACIIAQGIPFLHCGQEFFRTKNGIENTYNRLDDINAIDWNLVDENQEYIDLLKQVIKIRKENSAFHYETIEEVQQNITLEIINNHLIKYTLKQHDGKYSTLIIYINGSKEYYPVDTEGNYDILYKDTNIATTVEIQPLSMVILGKI